MSSANSEKLSGHVFRLTPDASRIPCPVSGFAPHAPRAAPSALPLLGALLLVGLLSVQAQSLSLDWSTVGGGGGTSGGGGYTLSGTIGSRDAGTLNGGSYALEGGFWPGIVVPSTTGAPTLFVSVSGGTVTISWSPAATGLVLEETQNLSTPLWSPAPQGNPVTISLGGTSTFFRLRGP